MISLQILIIFFWIGSSCSQQDYDPTPCSSDTINRRTRYTCSPSAAISCRTFLVYRANHRFSTISAISNLFHIDPHTLLSTNINVTNSTQLLELKHEVLVPITCSCSADHFYNTYFTYTASPQNSTAAEIACDVYEGLVKSVTLAEENPVIRAGSALHVPLKCACLDDIGINDGIKYLVTYPLFERDSTTKVGKKFNVSVEEIWKFNRLDPFAPTVFPTTTVLVPVRDEPVVNFSIPDSGPPTPQFLPTKPVEKRPFSQLKKVYVAGSVVGFCLILALLISCGLYIKVLRKCKDQRNVAVRRVNSLNSCSTPRSPLFSGGTRSSTNSCLSPDLLVGIKYSLCNYSVEELRIATRSFSEEAKMSSSMYKGLMKNDEVMIKQMRFEATKQVIDVHSRINHVNIVKLLGVCYGDDNCSWSYLVLELPSNGSLRDCLSSSSAALHWHRRTQIAFDVATGLHYLHYSVTPAYAHLSLNSRRIFLTSSWRAKIGVCGPSLARSSGWIAPECDVDGAGSEKVEIFGLGVVLLELISGKEGVVKETMSFLGGNEGGCFDQLRKFVDPCLKDDYPLAEALCLAVLAASCVEDDPMHRPSMEDVLKILARML